MIKGTDISNLNGLVNIQLLKDTGHEFVIAKATEGSTFVDKFYNSNIKNAKALGLITGAYHFGNFKNVAKAIQEANFFKQIAAGEKPDFVVLDFEQQCSGDMTDACLAFLDAISSIAPAVIYCNPNYIKSHLNSKITKYPLWIANYGISSPNFTLWSKYAIWQYTDKGQISGISGYVDLNYMAEDFYNSVKRGEKKVDAIIIFRDPRDLNAVLKLSAHVKCPIISNSVPFDFSGIKRVIGIGPDADKKNYTRYITQMIPASQIDNYIAKTK
ncbi:glycoside hydrolase family 25 protein [Clostridium sp. HV4-5-A1G]|uniref:glycoside hydrolase family 25 protein n=1 Tax=Clostridium sp. HV4-5-A1G TaxID=2004595 RepID=UPI00123995A1|nr:glycoside hydrolase family 25 protein [Clostridium sp. HV4-5-A1G]KAA8674908.1 hypothetical protein F3O63_06325 [Clostridium sp. HV4-5-A1G]